MGETKKQLIIEIDPEFNDILMELQNNIKSKTWDGLEKVSYKSLTRILARKIRASKII